MTSVGNRRIWDLLIMIIIIRISSLNFTKISTIWIFLMNSSKSTSRETLRLSLISISLLQPEEDPIHALYREKFPVVHVEVEDTNQIQSRLAFLAKALVITPN